MANQREEEDRKGARCAWQIHYYLVFPVKYRKALLDKEVTTIIQETAAEIAARFPIEMEAIGTDKNHIHLLCSAHPQCPPENGSWTDCAGIQEHHGPGNLSTEAGRQTSAVGRRILDRRALCGDGRRASEWQRVERYVQRQGQPREDLRQLRMF
jgi:putative transposase